MSALLLDELVEALRGTWAVWARTGAGLDAAGWRAPSRCAGWDVAALFAHVSVFPVALAGPLPPLPPDPPPPLAAAEVLRRFNLPGGVAHTMADTMAADAVGDAAAHDPAGLVDRFAGVGPGALDAVATQDPDALVLWPAAGAPVPLVEALKIILLESVVHLLDVQHALRQAPDVPAGALRHAVHLLAEIPPAAEFIDVATGRAPGPVLPVLR